MKVHVDMNLCQSHGECVFVAPAIFDLGDDDVLVWKEEVDESQRAYASVVVPAKRFLFPPYDFAANWYWPEKKAGAAPASGAPAAPAAPAAKPAAPAPAKK